MQNDFKIYIFCELNNFAVVERAMKLAEPIQWHSIVPEKFNEIAFAVQSGL